MRRLAPLAFFVVTGCASQAPEAVEPPVARAAQRLDTGFSAGSLIIPMDTTYQNNGMLTAFGLVHQLLRNDVPVRWIVKTGKVQGGTDFTVSAKDFTTSTAIAAAAYRGGPFVVDSANVAKATPLITAWLSTHPNNRVHVATAGFTADVRRVLTAAPKIAVFVDGNEDIAFDYLNAAGIPDSTGKAWPTARDGSGVYAGYPDILTDAEIKGATTATGDGALANPDGTPKYCQLTSMHYAGPADEDVVKEVRAWLSSGPSTHAFMECEAVRTFENAVNGKFLTTTGLIDGGGSPAPLTNRQPDNTFAQYDGNFTASGGSFNNLALAATGAFRTTDVVLINQTGSTLRNDIVWMTGFVDGDVKKGKVSYLTGHQYSQNLPISTNPSTNGLRLFLNSLYESGCAANEGAPSLTFTKTAPATTSGSTITFTLAYANAGPGVAESVVVTDPVPTGTTFASATGGGTFSAGLVTWSLGNLKAGASGTVSFTVNAPTDGTYTNTAKLDYAVSLTKKSLSSNTTTTVKAPAPDAGPGDTGAADTGAPDATAVDTGAPDTTVADTGAADTGAATDSGASADTGAADTGAATDSGASADTGSPVDTAVTDTGSAIDTAVADTGAGDTAVADAATDAGPKDSDGDGLPDDVETAAGTDPLDADSDDDGVRDGDEPKWNEDTDGDGLINALDPDSDDDGLFDGTELGKACGDAATDLAARHCRADADPTTKTDPLVADTDGGGVKDGSEDFNLDGKFDVGETDPTATHGADDVTVLDTDKDGLSDGLEKTIGSDPKDADTDDDGLLDGQEPNPSLDSDHDGLPNVLDPDSDDDGLHDGTEMGKGCSDPATDVKRKRCTADADPTTRTSPLLKDTDGGGATDGAEDFNLDGKLDAGETDPTKGHPADDVALVDTDGDGLSDKLEATLGSDPKDADSDDDGVADGDERNPADDMDGDGKIDVLDEDSDGDGLFDGTESGAACDDPATDKAKKRCVADADPSTVTGVLAPDTDRGGVKDGDEDTNKDGKVDPGERNPLDPADDTTGDAGVDATVDGSADAESDAATDAASVDGSADGALVDATDDASLDGAAADSGSVQGGGCSCEVPANGRSTDLGAAAAVVALVMAARRRRGRAA